MKTGNFLKLEPIKEGRALYGIVTGFGGLIDHGVFLDIYDMGFPIGRYVDKSLKNNWGFPLEQEYNPIILTAGQFLEHLEEARDALKPRIESRDLVAACWASREHYLSGVIDRIRANGKDIQQHYEIKPAFAGTGVYVLSARTHMEEDRCNIDPSRANLEGIVIDPRVSPLNASRLVTAWFGSTFKSVEGVQDASGFAYFCHEIPEKAKDFVSNPTVFKVL